LTDQDDLKIDISDEAFAALQRRAEETGRTPEEEARAILIEALRTNLDDAS